MAKTKKRRAARGEGIIHERADGRWEYRYHDKDGVRHSVYGPSQAAVAEKKRAIQSALYEGTYVGPSAHTVSSWADYFFTELYPVKNLDTRASTYGHIKNHIKPFFKQMKLQEVGPDDVVRFIKYLQKKGLVTKTQKNIHGTLSQVFKSAIPKRIKANPAKGAYKFDNQTKREMRVFNEKEMFEFEDALNAFEQCSDIEKIMFQFDLLTGLCEAELFGLVSCRLPDRNGLCSSTAEADKIGGWN